MRYSEITKTDADTDAATALDEAEPLTPEAANKRTEKLRSIGDQRRAAQQQFASKMQALSQRAADL
jgi:hypothetical protein